MAHKEKDLPALWLPMPPAWKVFDITCDYFAAPGRNHPYRLRLPVLTISSAERSLPIAHKYKGAPVIRGRQPWVLH